MAELLETSQVGRCYSCLARHDEKRLQIHVVRKNLKVVLQTDHILLCYICKKIAEKSEQFINNVQNFQNLFQHFMDATTETIEMVIRKNQPIVELSPLVITPGDVLTLSGKDEEREAQLYIAQIKQEDGGDSSQSMWEGPQEDSQPEPTNESSKIESDRQSDSDDDLSSNDDDEDTYTGSRSNLFKAIKVHQMTLTREQCMEERLQKASEDRFVNATYKCIDCVRVFALKDTYESHLVLHQESSGKYECDVCKRRISTRMQLDKHKNYHFIRYKCSKCDYTRATTELVKEHYLSEHCDGAYAYTCIHCGDKYRSRISLSYHVTTKHNASVTMYNCNYCTKTYASGSSLSSHILRKHTQEQEIEPRHVCKECGRAFLTPHDLTYHSVIHSDKRDFLCVVCNKSFKTKSSLNYHYKTTRVHVEGADMLLQCDKCDKQFCTRRKLTQHMNVHLNIRPYKCDQCDSAFVTKTHRSTHIKRVHKGYRNPKNMECTFCNKLFDEKQTLVSHIRTHTGEKPFKCKECTAQFTHSGSLYNHVKLVHLKLTRDRKPKNGKKNKAKDK